MGKLDTTTTFKSLQSLDDVVLLKITNYLRVGDLINLGKTCKRFKNFTQHHFEKNCSSVRWQNNRNAMKLSESRQILRNIGKYLQTINLAIWSDIEFSKILLTLGSECSHLNSITLDSVRMNCSLNTLDPVVRSMFSKLKQFVLKRCYWTGCVWCPLEIFFGENFTLEQLSIIDCIGSQKLKLSGFQALKEILLVECRDLFSSVELQRCLENNEISTLSLTDVGTVNPFEPRLVNALFNSIESLTLDYHSETNFNILLRLRKLKRFRLQSNELYNVDELIAKLNPAIEELEVSNILITKTLLESLNSFKKLWHLSFERCSNPISDEFFSILPNIVPNLRHLIYTKNIVRDSEIVHMLRLMPKLAYLSLIGCNTLSIDTYLEILDILTKDSLRPKLRIIPFVRIESVKSFLNFNNVLC